MLLIDALGATADAVHWLELMAMLLSTEESDSLMVAFACWEQQLLAALEHRLAKKLDYQVAPPVLVAALVGLAVQSIFPSEAATQGTMNLLHVHVHNANQCC